MNFKEALAFWKTKNKPPRALSSKQLDAVNKLVTLVPGQCYFCSKQLSGRRKKWCSDICVDNFNIIRGQTHMIRYHVYDRDQGICFRCKVDTDIIRDKIFNSPLTIEWLELVHKTMGDSLTFNRLASKKSFWDAHHIIAVKDGGGCCGLENFMTICYKCHLKEHK